MQGRTTLVVGIVMLGAGTGWVLRTMGINPGVDWLWTLGLASAGVAAFAAAGMKKFGVVVGSFFLAASSLSLVRQSGQLTFALEVPLLFTALGGLLLISRTFPSTNWGILVPPEPAKK